MKTEGRSREQWQIACDEGDFDGEDLLECHVGGREILLVRTERGVVACPAICPHMEERLVHGFLDGNVLTCSKHLWQWDLSTGEPIGLAEQSLRVAPVRSEAGKLVVNVTALDDDGSPSG